MAIPQTAPAVLAIDNAVTLLFCAIAIPLLARLLLVERTNSKRLVIALFSGPLAIYLAVDLACSLLIIPDAAEIVAGVAGVNFSDSFNGFWFSWLCFWQLDSLTLVSMTSFFLTAERLAAIVFKRESMRGFGSIALPAVNIPNQFRSLLKALAAWYCRCGDPAPPGRLSIQCRDDPLLAAEPGPICCDDAGEVHVRVGQSGLQPGLPHKAEEREAQCCKWVAGDGRRPVVFELGFFGLEQ